jgi:hypothetical protein
VKEKEMTPKLSPTITIADLARELGTDAETLISFSGVEAANPASEITTASADAIRHAWHNTNDEGVYTAPTAPYKPSPAALAALVTYEYHLKREGDIYVLAIWPVVSAVIRAESGMDEAAAAEWVKTWLR